jgi:hypothetical protein
VRDSERPLAGPPGRLRVRRARAVPRPGAVACNALHPPSSDGIYEATANADPRHLYADVLVAIDAARCLNNGQPSALARWIDALDLCTGDRAPSTRPTTLALAPRRLREKDRQDGVEHLPRDIGK